METSNSIHEDFGRDERSLVKLPFTLLGRRGSRKQSKEIRTEWNGKDEKGRAKKFYKSVTGDSKRGLPDYPAEEVYIALLYLASHQGFEDRTVQIVPRQLLTLMCWADGGKEYKRLEKSLDQLAGVRIKTNALWDNHSKAFIKANFGIIETYKIQKVESAPLFGEDAGDILEVTWNEELLNYFQRARFKLLNIRTFYSLSSPLAKRLYRWVDEAIYPSGHVEIDIMHLAYTRLEMSRSLKYPSQVLQKLEGAMNELKGRGICTWRVEESRTESGKKLVFDRIQVEEEPSPPPPRDTLALIPSPPKPSPHEAWLDEQLAALAQEEVDALKQQAVAALDPFNRNVFNEKGDGAIGTRALIRENMRQILIKRGAEPAEDSDEEI